MTGLVRDGLDSVRRGRRTLSRGTTWWREVLLLGVLYGAYELSRGLGDANVQTAITNGHDILHFERMWHMAPEQVLNEAVEQITWIAVAASYFYSLMHYVVTPVVLVWMYRKHSEHYGRARTALAMSTALGLIGYLLLPTAPPRMLAHSGLQDTLAHTSGYGWWGGEGSVPRGLGALTNQFAAMPSLHVGWAIWCGVLVALYARRRWVKALGIAYPVATTVVVMATANHYLLDALAGAVTMAAGAGLMWVFTRRARDPRSARYESLDEVIAGNSLAGARAAATATRNSSTHEVIAAEKVDQECSRGTSR
ncbi:MAG: hypothetical protein QOH89_356 [Pseudonocardiales bacterium]|nr:hypothetical protein [Pseudonocardiales bacterium]MDT4941593.1 hypothetical protein [Pseudonocardiales bacterium]